MSDGEPASHHGEQRALTSGASPGGGHPARRRSHRASDRAVDRSLPGDDPRRCVWDPRHAARPFLLARTLHEPIAAGIGLLAATERVLPCLEIVDSRYDGAQPRLADHIADNCATAGLLVGEGVPPPAEGHLRRVRPQLHTDGAVRTPPSRAHAIVPPLEAATWLANRMLQAGNRPEPGTLLVSPIASRPVELLPGLRVTARFEGIGSVDLQALPSTC